MAIHRIESNADGITLYLAHNKSVTIPAAQLNGTKFEQETQLVSLLQRLVDKRQRVNRLPADDPSGLSDPGLPWEFWEGTGNQRVLVSREIIIKSASWNEELQRFDIRWGSSRSRLE